MMHELLHHEVTRRNNFERKKYEWRMPRNPVTGEPTPRIDEGEGEFIIDPRHRGFQTVRLKDSPRVAGTIGFEEKGPQDDMTRSIHFVRTKSLQAKQNAMEDQLAALSKLIDKRQNNLTRSLERNRRKFI